MNYNAPAIRVIVLANLFIHILLNFFIPDPVLVEEIYTSFGLSPADFWNGSWWQPITCLFLHGGFNAGFFGVIHVTVNMYALWSIGTPVERIVGSARFVALYFVAGACSSLFVILGHFFQHEMGYHSTIGASGAVLGILGALAIFYPRARVIVFVFPMSIQTAAILIGGLSIFAQIFGYFPIISHLGHLGGLVGGYLYTRFALQSEVRVPENPFFTAKSSPRSERLNVVIRRPPPDPYSDTREEKQINLPPESDEPQESSGGESDEYTPGGKKLYYDPETGKFHVQ